MAELAKTHFCTTGQMLPFEFPISYIVNPHWRGAFVNQDLSVPPMPVNPRAALFTCVSTNKRHVEAQIKISALFHMYIDVICKAICCAWQDWSRQAVLKDVVINSASATGGTVTGPPWKPVINDKGPKDTKMKRLYTKAIAKAIGEGWKKYEASLKPAGLAWYPSFATSPPGPAVPANNVPTPVSKLAQDASALQQGALKEAMLGHLTRYVSIAQVISVASTSVSGGGVAEAAVGTVKGIISGSIRPHAGALMESIAYAFSTCFTQWQGCSLVTQVLGTGTNPTNVAAPVVNGKGTMTPGGFETATPDAAMMLAIMRPNEGFVSGLYNDKAPPDPTNPDNPNISKPARGLNLGGSHAIGYGTDIGKRLDPANLTSKQLFVRRLFNQLGYSNDQFAEFMRQERFLLDGEAEKLFELSMTDPKDGYFAQTRKLFPNLSSFRLDQQGGLIDLVYNYGETNLRRHGRAVIDAVRRGDLKAAGDAVLDLPNAGTTYGASNAKRATSIRASLQAPPIPDPCK